MIFSVTCISDNDSLSQLFLANNLLLEGEFKVHHDCTSVHHTCRMMELVSAPQSLVTFRSVTLPTPELVLHLQKIIHEDYEKVLFLI